MGKYSSDSDYDKRSGKRSESHKSSRRRRSDSSDSSEVRSRRGGNRDKRTKRSRRSRSRSRDNYSRSRRSESSSRSSSHVNSSRYRRKRRSRSKSRDRDRDRHGRVHRSRSRSYIREYTSRPRKHSSSSSEASASSDSRDKSRKDRKSAKKDSTKPSGNEKIDSPLSTKPEKQLAASSVSILKEEMPQLDASTLDEINSDSFAPKSFHSEKKPMENIVINLTDQTIKVPEAEKKEVEEATSLFHHNLFASEEARMQKWVKELYTYRQKALQQGARKNKIY